MIIQSRQLTLDLHNCNQKLMSDNYVLKETILEILDNFGIIVLEEHVVEQHGHEHKIPVNRTFMIFVLDIGHISVHIQPEIRYVALDVFLATEDANPDMLAQRLQSIFKPDTTKITHLRRGDFGSPRNIKPKTQTNMAPFRKIKSAGAKVIRILARRKR